MAASTRTQDQLSSDQVESILAESHRSTLWHDRKIQQQTRATLENYVKSILADKQYVDCIRQEYEDFPLIANRRNGVWYHPNFDDTCYFKSTDGHHGNWNFSSIRLNLNVLESALSSKGVIIVDSTRRGKRFPDALSKTIPIWCAVLNAAMFQCLYDEAIDPYVWLFLPQWVTSSEKSCIKELLPKWVEQVTKNKQLMDHLQQLYGERSPERETFKPLRCVWITREPSVPFGENEEFVHCVSYPRCCNECCQNIESSHCAFLQDMGPCKCPLQQSNDLPVLFGDFVEFGFLPVVCLSASMDWREKTQRQTMSWTYIQGAGDDEEAWANILQPLVSYCLTPAIFWDNVETLLREDFESLPRSLEQTEFHSDSSLDQIASKLVSVVHQNLLIGKSSNIDFSEISLGTCSSTSTYKDIIIDLSVGIQGDLRESACSTGTIEVGKPSMASMKSSGETFLYTYCPVSQRKNVYSRSYWTESILPVALDCAWKWLKMGEWNCKLLVVDESGDYSAPVVLTAILLAFFEPNGTLRNWATNSSNDPNGNFSKEDIRQYLMLVQLQLHHHEIPRRFVKELNNFFIREDSGWKRWLARKT